MSLPQNYMRASVHWLIDTYQNCWTAMDSDHEATGPDAPSALAALHDLQDKP